jgi:hypothetical protein
MEERFVSRFKCLMLALVTCVALASPALPRHQPADETSTDTEEAKGHEVESHSELRLSRQVSWMFRSFLRDQTDDATTLRLEFESYSGLGAHEIKNISYFEVAKYDRGVPGQPPGNPEPGIRDADGINDLLTAFWISKKGAHHGKHHFSPGIAAQFPTASDDSLGSGKWSVGPSFDYEYENGPIFAGAIALQIWSFAGDEDRKDVNMLMIKLFSTTRSPRSGISCMSHTESRSTGTSHRAIRCISRSAEGCSGTFIWARCR